jgi:hypothetical protein
LKRKRIQPGKKKHPPHPQEGQGGDEVGTPGTLKQESKGSPAWAGSSLCIPTETNSTTPQVQVETKYMGKLCGLCGNFDGKIDNEFLSEDGKLRGWMVKPQVPF